jgi:cobalt-zinc-cadmium efflux system outer membrane protein
MSRHHVFILTSALGLAVGCAGPDSRTDWPPAVTAPFPSTTPPLTEVRQVSHEQPASAGPLDLSGVLALAVRQSPDLSAAAARVGEAYGQMVQAGLYPNPTVGYTAEEINDGPGTAGQQGAFVAQEVVTGGKLQVAREAARRGLTAAEWQAVTRWFETVARVRTAYYEYQTARAILREGERIAEQFEEGLREAEKLRDAGIVLNYEVLRFRVELTQARNRVGLARERVAAAERTLAAVAGVAALPGPLVEEALPPAVPELAYESAAAAGDESSAVRAAAAAAEQAREEIRLAELQNVPNLRLQAGVSYDFALPGPIANVQAGVMLPVFNMNQGNILAARARLAAATAAVEQTRLQQRERLAAAFQRYHNARRQAVLFEEQVIPDARSALAQVEKVYAATGQRFFETLDARRVLAQARIDYLQALGDAWQAVGEIEAITQPSAAVAPDSDASAR